MAYSLNQIDKIFLTFAQNHKQLNSYGFGDPSDIGNNTLQLNWSAGVLNGRESSPVYPLLWVSPQPSEINRHFVIWKLTIIICDQIKKDDTNQTEVLSDTQQIMQDCIANLQAPAFVPYFTIGNEFSYTITPFTEEKFDDETAGWLCDIELRTVNVNDRCAIPMVGAPTS